MNSRQRDLEPLRDSWGMPVCFHKIECPVGSCEWTNLEFEAFVTNAIYELEGHLWGVHRPRCISCHMGRSTGVRLHTPFGARSSERSSMKGC